MFRYAFRLHRWGMIGFAASFALVTAVVGATYAQLAGTSAAARAIFAHQMTVLGPQFTYMIPLPQKPDTLAGYELWKAWDSLPIALAIWAIAAAASAVRGDEEKMLVDSWIAARASRRRIVLSRVAAFAVAAAVASASAGIGAVATSGTGVDTVGIGNAAQQSLVLWLVTVDLFAICFLVAQLPATKRAAQGACALILLVLFVINAAARTNHSLDQAAWVSPFHWFDTSSPLPSGGYLDPAGLAASAICVVVATAVSIALFATRDIRGPVLRLRLPQRAGSGASPSPLLGFPLLRLLYRRRWMLLTWMVVVAGLGAYLVGVFKSAVTSLVAIPGMKHYFTAQGVSDPYVGFIALFWFGIAQLLITGFAIHLVSTWASDDGEGILGAELSRPRRRWAVVAERFGEALVGVALIAVVGSVAVTIFARLAGTGLDLASVSRATVLLVPFALTYTAVGAVGSVWWPRASVGALGVVVLLSYLINELGPIVKLPSALLDLSPFSLYGHPLITGVYWTGLYVMVAVVVAGYAAATYLMQRRDLAA